MKILMLHPHDIYSNHEPWTVRITYIASEFVKRGHEVRLIYHLIDPKTPLEDATKRQEYPFVTIPAYRYQFALLAKMRSTVEFARWADVIHFQKCFAHVSAPAIWAGRKLGKPLHYDWDDWEYGIYNYNPPNRMVGYNIDVFEKLVPRMVDTVSYASDGLHQMALDYGVPGQRLFEAHVGADIERFHPGIDGSRIRQIHDISGPIVLYLGQLHGAQYAELFLQAAKIVMQHNSECTFLVVGGGDRFGELYQLAEALGINHRFVFTGPVDHDQVPLYIAEADVAVAAFADTAQTRCKSPLKIVEYLAMGKAIVASRMGEVINMVGDSGVLVQPGDADEMADGILRLLADPDLRRRLGQGARQRAEQKYNWGVTAENLLSAYQLALEERRWLYWKQKKNKEHNKALTPQPKPRPASIKKSPPPNAAPAVEQASAAFDLDDEDRPETQTAGPGINPHLVMERGDVGEAPEQRSGTDGPAIALPLDKARGPLGRLIHHNLDIVGVLDGEYAYVGPHTLQLDPTNRCNNDCLACWCRSPLLLDKALPAEQRSQTLPIEMIEQLLDDIAAMGSKEVYVAGGGEPYMHPQIQRIIQGIKSHNLVCNINTNFTLIDEQRLQQLIEAPVDYMNISVWAGSPETYSLLHPNKTEETFHQIRKTLTRLNKEKREVPRIKVYHVISNLNFHEIDKMIDFARDTGSESVEFTVVDTIPARTDGLLLNEQQRAQLYQDALDARERLAASGDPLILFRFDQFLRRISADHTTVGEHDRTIIDTMPCTVGWQFARVLADGNVNSCLKSHRIPIGNLHQTGFRELWNGSRQREFRLKANVKEKRDPYFRYIGNDPDAQIGCYKSCDDLGRIEHMKMRIDSLSPHKRAILKAVARRYRRRNRMIGG
ncbi:MAG: glycosyltransferase [Candidatus Alcyoniella australis]|nr:glycosyltransferase [Candidatus Alcyoniella australis]